MSAEVAVAAPAATDAQGEPGRLVAVAAPKGGVGKTAVAVSTAIGLARRHPNGVVLVDADLQFGDVAAVLDLEPDHTLPDLAQGPAAADVLVLKTMLTQHASGVFVVCAAPSPEAADAVTPARLGMLLAQLRLAFDWVVVDTTPALGEHTLTCLDQATDTVLLTSLTVPSIRALRTELALLDRIGHAPGTTTVVVNRTTRAGGLQPADAARILERSVDVVVPHSAAVPVAANRGVPLLVDAPRDAASRAVLRIVDRIATGSHTAAAGSRP